MQKEIFVFGSNLAGIHGAGAAHHALMCHGAIMGIGIGQQGQSYAIPTKDENINSLPLWRIRKHVEKFLCTADCSRGYLFHVTQIGCGLAGFTADQIAPMFAMAPSNCQFSTAWSKWLPNHKTWTEK